MPRCSDNGFSRRKRLLNSAQFTRLFRRGVRFSSPCFQAVCLPNDIAAARLGIAVSRRAVRYAHQRNRIKRIIRESFRSSQNSMPACDIVISARASSTTVSSYELFQQLAWIWRNSARFASSPDASR